MYPLYTNDHVPYTCYRIADNLVHHMHNLDSAQLHSHQRAASLQISGAIDLLMIAAIDSAARSCKDLDTMLRVAAAMECLDAAADELADALQLNESPNKSLGVIARSLDTDRAALRALSAELRHDI